MDLRSEVENEQFLKLCGSPFKSMCKIMNLKSGVLIIAIFDMIAGVLGFLGVVLLSMALMRVQAFYMFFIVEILIDVVKVAAIPFALIGIRGMNRIVPEDISLYSKFKIVELGVNTLLYLLKLIQPDPEDYHSDGEIWVRLIFTVLGLAIGSLWVKVVWSADIRLKYNETVLVMHGEEALRLMQQQATNLANPKVITPGMPIYFSPPT